MSTEHLLADFGSILHVLIGTNDATRQEAEKHLRTLCVQFSGDSLLLLAQIGAQGVGGFQLDQRLLALVLLRRIAFEPLSGLFLNESRQHATAPFDVVGERTTRARIENVLCSGLKDEVDGKLRRGLGDCVSHWITQSGHRQRPCYTLTSTLFELMGSNDPTKRYTPWQVINFAPTLLVDSVNEPISSRDMANLLIRAMGDEDRKVAVQGMKAMRSVILEALTGLEREQIGGEVVYQAFQVLNAMHRSMAGNQWDVHADLVQSLEPLVDLASTYPALFKNSIDISFPLLLAFASPPPISSTTYTFSGYPASSMAYEAFEELANPAVEVLLSLAELRSEEVIDWRGGLAPKELVGLLLGRLVCGLQGEDEECQDWREETDLDEEDVNYPVFPEEALDRLSVSLGGEVILPALSTHVQALLQQPDWRCRYAALISVGSVAEGSSDAMQQELQEVLRIISPSMHDPHPRVRYAFLHCMGQLCKDLNETLQKQYSQDTLNALLHLLKDSEPRVRAHAAACMVNFFDDSEIPPLTNLLEDIVRSLFKAFQQGPLYMQEQVMATLAALAMHAGGSFVTFYRESIDLILSILMGPSAETHRKLVGRAIECGSLLGLAVGKATFSTDAAKLAAVMISIQNSIVTADDPRMRYLIDAWGTFCRILGQDFKPFLPHVIPPLLKAAAYKPTPPVTKLSLSEEETASISKVHSAELDDKILAFDNLTVYAHTLAGSFEPYLGKCMELTLEALTFTHSEDVRESAAFLVPALLYVAKESNAWAEASGPLQEVFKTMIDAMAKEVDFGYLALLFKSFTDALHIVGVSLPPQLSGRLFRIIRGSLDDLQARREDRLSQEEYMDEGDLQIYTDEEAEEKAALEHMSKAMEVVRQYDQRPEVGREVDELWRTMGRVDGMVLGQASAG